METGSYFSRERSQLTTGGVILVFISYERCELGELLLRWRLGDPRSGNNTAYLRESFVYSHEGCYLQDGVVAYERLSVTGYICYLQEVVP